MAQSSSHPPSRSTLPEMQAYARLSLSAGRHLIAGVAAIALMFGVAGGWAATAEFAGAVIASGQFVVDSSVKKVQHPTGGVVGELNVRDGARVKAGDVLLRLDETVTRANLAIVSKGLDELNARLARLEAERDGRDALAVPQGLANRSGDDDVLKLIAGETTLLRLRAEAREGQRQQLAERVTQFRQEIEGHSGQIAAKQKQSALLQRELVGVRDLFKRKLVQIQRVTSLERDAAQLEGERGQLVAAVAQAHGKITETELRGLQIDQDLRSEVAKELREVQGKIAELVERKVAAEDQLKRIDLRAPQDGIVHQLAVHTVGGVINPGEPVMMIVPDAERLTVEVKINPQDIDNVRVGQTAALRLSAFNQRTTPEVGGEVQRVSPDLSTDQRTGQGYYTARIALSPTSASSLQQLRLVPGMPVEAFIQTSSRTVLSYLTKPMADQVSRAFREK